MEERLLEFYNFNAVPGNWYDWKSNMSEVKIWPKILGEFCWLYIFKVRTSSDWCKYGIISIILLLVVYYPAYLRVDQGDHERCNISHVYPAFLTVNFFSQFFFLKFSKVSNFCNNTVFYRRVHTSVQNVSP